MEVVKITTLWDHSYYPQIPEYLLDKYKFEINNDCDKADFWFVWGGVRKKEIVNVPANNVFYIVDEAYQERQYQQSFLKQFKSVITCRNDIIYSGLIRHHDLGIWYFKKSYSDLRSLVPGKKERKISIVSSDLTWLPGHKKRFAFVNKMIGHFKDRIDVFGKGFNYVEDKFDALYPYQYSVAIENNHLPDYFTEKIFECYLTHTVPVYSGCTNIEQFFDKSTVVKIDIDDYKSSINTIEQLIEDTVSYNAILPALQIERIKVLDEIHFFPAIIKILDNRRCLSNASAQRITIVPEFGSSFLSRTKRFLKKIRE